MNGGSMTWQNADGASILAGILTVFVLGAVIVTATYAPEIRAFLRGSK